MVSFNMIMHAGVKATDSIYDVFQLHMYCTAFPNNE